MEFYVNVLIEAAWTASVVPLGNEATFTAMALFGGYNMHIASILATAGAVAGHTLNWYLGQGIRLLKSRVNLHISDYWYEKISHIFNKYLLFLLLLSWAPMFKFIVVLSGFVNTRPKVMLPLVTGGNLLYYISLIA